MLELVGTPKDRFSLVAAQIAKLPSIKSCSKESGIDNIQ